MWQVVMDLIFKWCKKNKKLISHRTVAKLKKKVSGVDQFDLQPIKIFTKEAGWPRKEPDFQIWPEVKSSDQPSVQFNEWRCCLKFPVRFMREWNDTRTVACSQTSRRQVTWVRMVHRTLMSQRCHVFCLYAASTHLKSTGTRTGHASTVPPHVKPTVLPSSRQLYGYQLRWTYANSRDID